MTGPQLPSPEHATTLDADFAELRVSVVACVAFKNPTNVAEAKARADAAESRLRSRITALELENERLRGKA